MTELMNILTELEQCGDVTMETLKGTTYVTIQDFAGFDDKHCEITREYEKPALIGILQNMIRAAMDVEGVDPFKGVRIRYASEDI